MSLPVEDKSVAEWKKSAHHGAKEWVSERLTSIILIPLVIWAVGWGVQLSHAGYDAALAFARRPLHAGLIGVLALVSCWHMYMGLKVVIDDYVAKPALNGVFSFLAFALSAGLFLATAAALYLVNQGT